MKNRPVLIVAGEPNSIFSEVLLKSLKYKNKKKFVLICSKNLFARQMKKLGYNYNLNQIEDKSFNIHKLNFNKINIINVNYNFKKAFDKISFKSNKYLENSFKIASRLLKTKKFSGLINGPIAKRTFLKNRYLGITEYLAKKTKTKNFSMLIYNKKLSVCPITTHIPLKDVHKKLSKKVIIKKIDLINKFYKYYFKRKPIIAVCGLNPHCESNYKTSEEKRIIKPAIKHLLKKKYSIYGPFPADTIFMKNNYSKFDVVIGMYHDQVLTPMKSLFEFDAINITIGLPYLRITPDHGPNEKMIGKNLSNPQSLIKSMDFFKNK